MCLPPANYMPHFIKFGKTAVLPHTLYTEPNDDTYGYEKEQHVTLKYGFTPDLKREDIAGILKGIKPFIVTIKSLSLFKNEKYHVVKFDVELNDVLIELRKRCDAFKNEDKYPEYHPHSTVAYVKPGTFPHVKDNLNIKLPISRIKYSGIDGKKLFINL